MLDLRRASPNVQRLRHGGTSVDNLEWEVAVDTQLSQADLAEVEIEVNKKRRKKQKAELSNEMLAVSPASSVDRSLHQIG